MADAITEPEATVSLKTWITVGGALLGAFMAVLNIQITNASLPYIEGGIGTGGINGAWVITAYLIGEIIVIPMTDFLSRVFSLRRYMIANTVLFLCFSAACGQASSLPEMITLRALQGFSGGVLIPLAFTIIVAMLPPSKRPLGLAGFAVTATFAPAIGPTIGGWLTDNYGWQAIFYINLVPGAVMLGALIYGLPRTAMRLDLLRHGDWLGIALMAVGLAALQTVLDDGDVYDWFDSPFIVKLSLLAGVMLSAFIVVELITKDPLVQLRLLARRNFGFGTLGNFLVGFALYASAYLLPQVPFGLAGVQRAADRRGDGLDRPASAGGYPVRAASDAPCRPAAAGRCWARGICHKLLHEPAPRHELRGTAALCARRYAGSRPGNRDDAALRDRRGRHPAFRGRRRIRPLQHAAQPWRCDRHCGGGDFFTKREQFHSFIINADVSSLQPATQQRLAQMQQFFMTHGTPDPASALHRAMIAIGNSIHAEATYMGYADCFALLGVVLLCAIPAVAMLKKGIATTGGAH